MEKLLEIVKEGERENVEFKEMLSSYHLKAERFQSLACQMNHRLLMGKGRAIYVVGVSDSGSLKGIPQESFDETLSVLEMLALEIGARIISVEKYAINGGVVGIVEIGKAKPKEHILIGTAGHVDHGKQQPL